MLSYIIMYDNAIGMESRLGAYSAKGYFLQCCLCHLALGEQHDQYDQYEEYEEWKKKQKR